MQDTVLAQLCGLSAPPTNEMDLIQWAYTCGHRACKSKGYSAGRAVEYHGGMTTLECAREETLNGLEAGTLVQAINTTVNEVSKACVDRVNPAVTDSYPSNGYGQTVRFYNTCGRRYCMSKGFEGGGRVTMWSGGTSGSASVELICMK